MKNFDLIVIGGGAAGFFGAIQTAEKNPHCSVLILEKSTKLLSKVKVSGGGRCNVTHHCFNPIELAHHYPRGQKQLKELFKIYQAKDIVSWFEKRGVRLKTEEDGRIFPVTNSSQTIVDCFLKQAERLKIKISMQKPVNRIEKVDDVFSIYCEQGEKFTASKILIATGGHPNITAYSWMQRLGHRINQPIPSLFTFNDSEKKFAGLMGISVSNADVHIAGTKFSETGPLLITHWGLSGPAVIKLSAWAAEYLYQVNYQFTVLVNWPGIKEEEVRQMFLKNRSERRRQQVLTNPMFGLPQRLWEKLCTIAAVEDRKIWAELSNKSLNKLTESLIRCPFQIIGKTTFKEEFVTCGGIDLRDVSLPSMESKIIEGLYFAGEILNIDGETGGFNFQAAWTTAHLAAQSICQNAKDLC